MSTSGRHTERTTSIVLPLLLPLLLLAALLTLFPLSALANGAYSGGSGTEGDPYQISTAQDWTDLTNTSADWNKYFILTADIDLGGATLTPVGYNNTKFTGSVDGDGHVLSNATFNRSSFTGVFGYIDSSGRVSDLGVEDITVTGYYEIGGLAGFNAGSIAGCHATGSVSSSSSFECFEIGGLVGYNYQGTISDSYAATTVTSSGGGIDNFEIGGLVGYDYQGTISGCFASGSVSATYCYEVGGLAGGLTAAFAGGAAPRWDGPTAW